jgi:hypothetical protein
MTNMGRPLLDVEPDADVPEADAAEQRAEIVQAVRDWDADTIDPADERVVILDDEDYR